MKREFLQELRVGEQSLPKEVVDAIMAQNGRDIQNAKAAFADYEELKTRLEAREQEWEGKLRLAQEEHDRRIKELQFQNLLEREVMAAKGRSSKAIYALLDLETLQNCEDQAQAVRAALEDLMAECGYLFDAYVPAYARDTGAYSAANTKVPANLAGALREKFERK